MSIRQAHSSLYLQGLTLQTVQEAVIAIGFVPKASTQRALTQHTPAEQKALSAFETWLDQQNSGTAAGQQALKVLREAVSTGKVEAGRVAGALLFLEGSAAEQSPESDTLPKLQGNWRLVFSSPAFPPALQYIPVDEFAEIDVAKKTIDLVTDLGPVHTRFLGTFDWRPQGSVMSFGFIGLQLRVFGRVFPFGFRTKRKEYTYFQVTDDIACARSSRGGVILMHQAR
ncbi:hypothetical protein WJX72_001830 [[Myrmecia] bisecta]|uniref:Plastid lipid-associated protein/fibrillin conserved domain-containing protein n=1 Tax=[Myrmecia] bisecta TaxID=41462 RepID=A0AAW1PDU8_9CHLO